MTEQEQLPPASIEAEEAILGGIIFDPKALERICNWLPVEAFFVKKHQMIYQACLMLKEAGQKTDYITLVDWFNSRNLLEDVGGTAYLAQLLNRTTSAVNCDRYGKLILKKYQRRKLIAISYQILDLAHDQAQDLEDVYRQIRGLLPCEITGDSEERQPVITKARYSVFSSSGQHKIELEADIEDLDLDKATSSLKAQCEATAKKLWKEG